MGISASSPVKRKKETSPSNNNNNNNNHNHKPDYSDYYIDCDQLEDIIFHTKLQPAIDKYHTSPHLCFSKVKKLKEDKYLDESAEILFDRFADLKTMQKYLDTKFFQDASKDQDRSFDDGMMKKYKLRFIFIDPEVEKTNPFHNPRFRTNKERLLASATVALVKTGSEIDNLIEFSRYGTVHTAIQIGNVIINWMDCSLVLFASASSHKITNTLQMGELDISYQDDYDKLQRVLKRIIHWNLTKTYSELGDSCHRFCDEICWELDLPHPAQLKGNSIGKWVKNELHGSKTRTITIGNEKITFNTHKQLDDFIIDDISRGSQTRLTENDLLLLKGFDRAFWAEQCKSLNEVNCQTKSNGGCPFGDPFITESLFS